MKTKRTATRIELIISGLVVGVILAIASSVVATTYSDVVRGDNLDGRITVYRTFTLVAGAFDLDTSDVCDSDVLGTANRASVSRSFEVHVGPQASTASRTFSVDDGSGSTTDEVWASVNCVPLDTNVNL